MTEHVIIVKKQGTPGLLSGVLGCVFGLLGMFSIGLVFVPLAAFCALAASMRGVSNGSLSGIGLGLIAGFLMVAGFAMSPSLWALAAVLGFAATHP